MTTSERRERVGRAIIHAHRRWMRHDTPQGAYADELADAAISAALPERDDLHSALVDLMHDAQDLRDAERTYDPANPPEAKKLNKRQEEVRLSIAKAMALVYGEDAE